MTNRMEYSMSTQELLKHLWEVKLSSWMEKFSLQLYVWLWTKKVTFPLLTQTNWKFELFYFSSKFTSMANTCMLKVKGIHTKSPKTNMKPNLSAIMSQLQKTKQ